MTKDIKYLCLVRKLTEPIAATLEEIPPRGGFYNWLNVFKGDLYSYDSVEDGTIDLEDYDVVHVNMPPVDQIMIPEIRKKLGWNSSTKLVLNNDHVPEVWNGFVLHPQQYHTVQ